MKGKKKLNRAFLFYYTMYIPIILIIKENIKKSK